MIFEKFTMLDWGVVFGYLGLTTLVGHCMKGKQASIRDFFLGGRTLPWWAVCGSIIATEISGVTFIGVPGTLFALEGNFTYLQWAIGSIIARVIIGIFFVRVYYEREIYSPYDYMSNRLGPGVKKLATVFFAVGSILAQSVRVLVAALPLKIVTPLPFEACIAVIGVFAIGWTLMGGMRTVIWTDVMQFGLFAVGGLISLFWLVGHLDGGWGQLVEVAGDAGKFKTFDFRFGFGNELRFTFWVALIAVPFLNLNAFGVDQLNAQRMFCCRDAKSARKAIIFSSFGQLVTIVMLMVGAALWVHYQLSPPAGEVAAFFNDENPTLPGKEDRYFPTWIVTELPPGLSGLILAGVFAAAISSLDSILAALSQTTLSLFYRTEDGHIEGVSEKKLVRLSRILVVLWGLVLTGFTWVMSHASNELILPLAFGMTSYTVGPMLAMFFCALLGKGSFRGLMIGSILAFTVSLCVGTDLMGVIIKLTPLTAEMVSKLPTYTLSAEGHLQSVVSFVWMWPVATAITLALGLLIPPGKSRNATNEVTDGRAG
jgi:SSS family solute:Na+ symporter